MGKSRCPTKGWNWAEVSLQFHKFELSSSVDITPHKNFDSLCPFTDEDHILEKKVSLIVFRQVLPKILSVAYIFSNPVMTNLKNLIGNKFVDTKNVQQDYLFDLSS